MRTVFASFMRAGSVHWYRTISLGMPLPAVHGSSESMECTNQEQGWAYQTKLVYKVFKKHIPRKGKRAKVERVTAVAKTAFYRIKEDGTEDLIRYETHANCELLKRKGFHESDGTVARDKQAQEPRVWQMGAAEASLARDRENPAPEWFCRALPPFRDDGQAADLQGLDVYVQALTPDEVEVGRGFSYSCNTLPRNDATGASSQRGSPDEVDAVASSASFGGGIGVENTCGGELAAGPAGVPAPAGGGKSRAGGNSSPSVSRAVSLAQKVAELKYQKMYVPRGAPPSLLALSKMKQLLAKAPKNLDG